MQNVDWKKFLFVAAVLLVGANLAGTFLGSRAPSTQAPAAPPELRVLVSSQPSEGVTETDLSPQLAQAFENYAVSRIRSKLVAMAKEAGAASPQPSIRSESVVLQTQGKKLVVARYEINNTSRAVEVWGISGATIQRVMCTRDSLDEILLTSGPCGAKIQEVHGVRIGG